MQGGAGPPFMEPAPPFSLAPFPHPQVAAPARVLPQWCGVWLHKGCTLCLCPCQLEMFPTTATKLNEAGLIAGAPAVLLLGVGPKFFPGPPAHIREFTWSDLCRFSAVSGSKILNLKSKMGQFYIYLRAFKALPWRCPLPLEGWLPRRWVGPRALKGPNTVRIFIFAGDLTI